MTDRPQLGLGLVQQPSRGADVEKDDLRVTLDQPTTVGDLHAAGTHRIDRPAEESEGVCINWKYVDYHCGSKVEM